MVVEVVVVVVTAWVVVVVELEAACGLLELPQLAATRPTMITGSMDLRFVTQLSYFEPHTSLRAFSKELHHGRANHSSMRKTRAAQDSSSFAKVGRPCKMCLVN